MRINDNGFTERVATPAAPPTPPSRETEKAAGSQSATGNQPSTNTGDNLQLSGFAARLNDGLAADTSNRASKVSLVANAVSAGTFRIDTAAVSRSIVTEGLQNKR
jgi:anti-sigma28 factor (negative regulator of flagellin synthesis)